MSDPLRFVGTNSSLLFVSITMAALSLTCKQCNASLKSVKEAQDHGEATGHSQFEESTEPVSHAETVELADQLCRSQSSCGLQVLNLQCTICGKPCRNQTEKDMHSRHTGHLEFQNKASNTFLAGYANQLVLLCSIVRKVRKFCLVK